jgi:lipase maturation factor 1
MGHVLLSPALVWGVIPRFVGVLYIIAFGSLVPQLNALLGSRGLGPIAPFFARVRRDFPGLRRFLDFPTLLWLSSSDRTLRVVPWLGVASGVVCVIGGPLAPFAHVLSWLLWLSLEPAMLLFPWDTMLQEAGFLSLFLPNAQLLPTLEAEALPDPSVAFMFRFFVLRLMLGFGKVKFLGSRREDSLYMRGFFVWSSPNPVAWFAHHLPAFVLRGMLYFMFVAEVIAPLLGFFAGPARIVSFALLGALMIGIQLTGNWGYFNIGYLLLASCLLDTQSSIFDLGQAPWASQLWTWPALSLHTLMGVLFVTGLLYLVVFDSWTTRSLVQLPLDAFSYNRRWLRVLLAYLKAISPLRIVNGYGVFPPHAQPPMREMPVFEGSDDGITWKAYRFRHIPSSAKERPRFVAPYHPRIDMASAYAGHCLHDGSLYGSMTGDGKPYAGYARSSWLERMCQRLLEAEPVMLSLFGHNPFPDGPPKLMRVAMDAITPTSFAVRKETGDWWQVRRCAVIIPPHGREAWPDALLVSEPEVFHPDFVGYKRRAAPLRAIASAHQSGQEPNRAILVDSDLTVQDVRAFWDEFVPALNKDRGEFSVYNERARELEARFGRLAIARFERVLERYAWLLRLRTERHQFADALPKLEIVTNFRYHMYLHELVMDGEPAYHAYLEDVHKVVARLAQSSDERQIWTLSMLRYQMMIGHMGAFRFTNLGSDLHKMNVPGIFEYYPVLSRYALPLEEFRPEVVKRTDGDYTIAGFYPPPKSVAHVPAHALATRAEGNSV